MMRGGRIMTAIAAIAVIALLSCRQPPAAISDALIGVWKTADGRYAGRYLEITKTSIVFGTGEEDSVAYALTGMEKTRDGDTETYTLRYTNPEGLVYELPLSFDATKTDVIRLSHQREVAWMKDAPSSQGHD